MLVLPLLKVETSGAGARVPALSVASRGVPLCRVFYLGPARGLPAKERRRTFSVDFARAFTVRLNFAFGMDICRAAPDFQARSFFLGIRTKARGGWAGRVFRHHLVRLEKQRKFNGN